MFNKSFESPIAIYQEFFFGYNLPPFIKQIVIFLLGLFVSKRLADDLKCVKVYDREEIDRVYKLKARFCAHIAERWKTESLDAVISATYFHSAFKANDKDNKLALKADYTTFWNVLHYPAGVVPITEVLKEEEEGYEDGYNDIITKACRDNLRGSAGMPISLQVATLKFKDEQCLGIMKLLDDAVNFRKVADLAFLEKDPQRFQKLPFEVSWSFIQIISLLLMAAIYIFAGYMHFVNPGFYLKLMPKWIPMHEEMVLLSGVAEIAGGVGLLIPQTRKAAAWGIILLLFAVFPANIYMALHNVVISDDKPEGVGMFRWIRLPLQILAIKWARSFTK